MGWQERQTEKRSARERVMAERREKYGNHPGDPLDPLDRIARDVSVIRLLLQVWTVFAVLSVAGALLFSYAPGLNP